MLWLKDCAQNSTVALMLLTDLLACGIYHLNNIRLFSQKQFIYKTIEGLRAYCNRLMPNFRPIFGFALKCRNLCMFNFVREHQLKLFVGLRLVFMKNKAKISSP